MVTPGARMPGGEKLKRAKLRGVESDGMILSEQELGIGDDHDGIMVLDPGPEPGTPLAEVLAVAEPVIELEPTSNRVDCFGVYGVARELHAVTAAELAPPPWDGDAEATGEGTVDDYASVTVEVPELCPRFSARVFTEVEIGPSPPWLKARLDRRRDAADQQRRRHHQLRDADDRPAASRIRPRRGAAAARSSSAPRARARR